MGALKNNLDWYKHQTSSHGHRKFKAFRVMFKKEFNQPDGWGGEGRFWALNNMIADSENCQLSLTNELDISTIASDLDFTMEEFHNFINILLKCRLIKITDQHQVFTDDTQECLTSVQHEREYARQRKKAHRERVLTEMQGGTPNKFGVTSEIPAGHVYVPPVPSALSTYRVEERRVEKSREENNSSFSNPSDVESLVDNEGGENEEKAKKKSDQSGEGIPPPKKKRASKKNPEATPYWQEMIGLWKDFNFEKFGARPSMSNPDYSALKRLIAELRKRATEQNVEWTDVEAKRRLRGFLGHAWLDDKFFRKSFLLPILESHKDKVLLNQIPINGNGQQQAAGKSTGRTTRAEQSINELESVTKQRDQAAEEFRNRRDGGAGG